MPQVLQTAGLWILLYVIQKDSAGPIKLLMQLLAEPCSQQMALSCGCCCPLLLLLLPPSLQVMFSLFGSIAIAWGVVLWRSQKHTAHAIHWLMLGLVVFKTLTLMAQVKLQLPAGGAAGAGVSASQLHGRCLPA